MHLIQDIEHISDIQQIAYIRIVCAPSAVQNANVSLDKQDELPKLLHQAMIYMQAMLE